MDQPLTRIAAQAEPAPTVDRANFRDAMARLGSAVCIVTSDGASGLAGCTATAVCSVTDDPPTLIVCLNRTSRNNAVIRENGRLCVNVLGAADEAVARTFADGSLTIDQRFAGAPSNIPPGGSPALEDAAATIQCDIAEIAEVGSHSVFYCRVRAIDLGSDKGGLVYLGRSFHAIAPTTD